MNRNVKVLGAALLVALTICAFGASAASAESFSFYSEIEHTTLTGSATGTHTFTIDAGAATCGVAQFSGTLTSAKSTEVTITPSYESCTADPAGSVDLAMNGCQYVLVPITKEGAAYKTEMKLVCGEGKSLTALVTLFGVTKCTISIPAQTFGSVTLTQVSEGDIGMEANISGIDYSQTPGTGIGACTKAEGTTNGTYKGSAVIAGSLAEAEVNIAMQPPKQIISADSPIKFTGKDSEKVMKIYNVSGADLKNGLEYSQSNDGNDFSGVEVTSCKALAKDKSCEVKLKCKTASGKVAHFIIETMGTDPHGVAASRLEGC